MGQFGITFSASGGNISAEILASVVGEEASSLYKEADLAKMSLTELEDIASEMNVTQKFIDEIGEDYSEKDLIDFIMGRYADAFTKS